MRQRFDYAESYHHKIMKGFRLEMMKVTVLSDNYQLTVEHPPLIWADPGGGAKDLLLPAAGQDTIGLMFVVVNAADADESITVKDSLEAGTITVIGQNEMAIYVSDGVTWRGLTGVV